MGHKLGASLGTTNVTCWNCGGSHTLKDCIEPHDEAQIAESLKDFFDKKREQAASDDPIDHAEWFPSHVTQEWGGAGPRIRFREYFTT